MVSLRANAGVQGGLISALQSNAATQADAIVTINANVAAANLTIAGLTSNAATQSDGIATINSNVTAANLAIASLQSNAGTQATSINLINANVTAANANAAAQSIEIAGLRANITASNVEVVSLRANAGVQGGLINTINANVTAANVNIETLFSNAGVQAATLANLLTTDNSLAANLQTVYAVFALGNLAFANTANIQTSNTFLGNVSAEWLLANVNLEAEGFIKVGPAHDQGQSWANPGALFFGNTASVGSGKYYQLNLQNVDPEGSGDIVVTADDGNDTSNYIAFGINNSLYNDPQFPGSLAHDGYVAMYGGNLYLTSNTHNVAIGTLTSNVVFTQTGNLQLSNANLVFSDGTRQTTAFNQTTQANIGVLYNLIALGNVEFGNVRADLNAANAAISTVDANVVAANAAITSLSANVAAANAAIITANTGMKSYVDATILSNVAYTMANYQNWTSNVSSIGTALDQLAERLKAAGF